MAVADIALVTGATGWLGTRLVEILVHGLPEVPELASPPRRGIRCLVQRDDPQAGCAALDGVTRVSGDLTEPVSVRAFVSGARGATLFHCAGVIHPRRVAEFHAVNVEGTRRLVAAAVEAGVRRFVHVSSNSPFGGNASPEDVFDESSPYRPYMGYGRSKMLAEQAVAEAGLQGRLETVIVRAPWFYGPGQPPRQTQFFTMIKQGRFPLVGSGQQRRSMAFVDNLCQGLLLAERAENANGRAFWIADERPYPFTEIVDTVERILEQDFGLPVAHRRLRLPGLVSDAARVGDRVLQAMGRYDQRLHVLSELNMTIACSVAQAKRDLGYRPTVALEEGMRRSVQWLLARGVTV